jgi:hypothetical protein
LNRRAQDFVIKVGQMTGVHTPSDLKQ